MDKQDVLSRLTEATLELTRSDNWQQWLKTRRSFHSYSFRNQILIAIQQPHVGDEPSAERCTRVAGYKKWRVELGRQVVKGAKGIWILGPVKRWETDELSGERVKRVVGFRELRVFDVSQTIELEGAPPLKPNLPYGEPIGPDDPDLFADLAAGLVDKGLVEDVSRIAVRKGALGWYDPGNRTIAVDESLAGAAAVRVLCHEGAHAADATLGDKFDDYALGELVAESAGFLVCDGLGIDSSGCSPQYLTAYTADMEDPARALSAVADRVLKVAEAIEEALRSRREEPCKTT